MQAFDAELSLPLASMSHALQRLLARAVKRLVVDFPHWFTAVNHRLHWAYLLSFVVLGGWAWWRHYRRPAAGGLKPLVKFLFPANVYLHPSALLDYQLLLANRVLGPASWLGSLLFGSASVAAVAHATQLGVAERAGVSFTPGHWTFVSALGFALTMTVARDFVTFLTHLAHHRVPLLWEFHKVHHSAEVLTPLTVFRKHPLYNVCEHGMNIALIGPLQGLIALGFVGHAPPVTLFGANIVFALFHLAGANLRHSHVWWSFGPLVSHVFSSPAQHQIHHSKAPAHADKNFGEVFALWDWLCGTLYVPGREPEALQFGLAGEGAREHRSLWRLYIQPFINCAALLRPARVVAPTPMAARTPVIRK
ncbi:MAG: sterol desaturase family protein [Gammaproteobacteria bacterium]|nr:sterol desaturase family protein [Gammaproteobacteria bacterium]